MNNFLIALHFLFAILPHFPTVSGDTITNYCAKEICPYQGPHVRCNNDGRFSSECVGQYSLEDMTPYVAHIPAEHNRYRNLIASGKLSGYYPATKMHALQWDWDLADNAAYNARRCVFEHDKCRSTSKFPYAGQNIYYTKTSNLTKTAKEQIEVAINLWFEENLYADHKLIESYDRTDPQTGHFTVIVNDGQTHVGCAMLNNLLNGTPAKRVFIIVCNYSTTNFKGRQVYKSGEAASECVKKSSKYPFLCTQ